MISIPAALRRIVMQRARNACEYCGLSQEGQEATFHIDHTIPRSAGGATISENLALACVSCSLHKSARQTVVVPHSGEEVLLFHPRRDSWSEHFRWEGSSLVGLTTTGQVTIETLRMNRLVILAIRQEEILLGRHPLPRA
jgi:hypothetical protein